MSESEQKIAELAIRLTTAKQAHSTVNSACQRLRDIFSEHQVELGQESTELNEVVQRSINNMVLLETQFCNKRAEYIAHLETLYNKLCEEYRNPYSQRPFVKKSLLARFSASIYRLTKFDYEHNSEVQIRMTTCENYVLRKANYVLRKVNDVLRTEARNVPDETLRSDPTSAAINVTKVEGTGFGNDGSRTGGDLGVGIPVSMGLPCGFVAVDPATKHEYLWNGYRWE